MNITVSKCEPSAECVLRDLAEVAVKDDMNGLEPAVNCLINIMNAGTKAVCWAKNGTGYIGLVLNDGDSLVFRSVRSFMEGDEGRECTVEESDFRGEN